MSDKPRIGLVMGSNSDWDIMRHAADMLEQFGVSFESRVVSAHRTPDLLFEYASTARERGLACIIAGEISRNGRLNCTRRSAGCLSKRKFVDSPVGRDAAGRYDTGA